MNKSLLGGLKLYVDRLTMDRKGLEQNWVVYLVKCADGSLYCGVTNDLKRRIADHNRGRGAKYTRSRRPVELAAVSSQMSKGQALQLEYWVKQQPASKKIHELTHGEDRRVMARLEKKLPLFQKEIKRIQTRLETLLKAGIS